MVLIIKICDYGMGAVDKYNPLGGSLEFIYSQLPLRDENYWNGANCKCIQLPKGSIKKLIGRELTFNDEPVKLEENE